MYVLKRIVSYLIICLLLLPRPALAITDNNSDYAGDIDKFIGAGADAYLAWQFSGDPNNPIENDPFSFFQGGSTCKILKQAGSKYPGKIGVNIFNYHKRYTASVVDGRSVNAVDLSYLKSECGTSIIRFFGTDDPGAVVSATQTLAGAGMKAVIALHNFAVGGQLSFYDPGGYATARQNAIAVASGLQGAGLTGSVYTLELSNEPHCGNDASCVDKYYAWAVDMVAAIRGTGYAGDISLGQASQVARNSRADSVKDSTPGHPTDFEYTNSVPGITKTSGHHYDSGSISENLIALDLSKKIGKTFYIGEAALGAEKLDEEIIYKTVPSQNGYQGGIPGCVNITDGDRTNSPFWVQWFMPVSNTFDKCFTPGSDWGYGTPVADPCGQAGKPTSISKELRVKWIGPLSSITHVVKTILGTPQEIATKGNMVTNLDFAAPGYDQYLPNGSFDTSGPKTNLDTLTEVNKSVTDLQAGSLIRTTPYIDLNDKTVDDWLCKLASSNNSKACVNDTAYQLIDLPLGYLGDMVEKDFQQSIPGAATVVRDRTVTRKGKPDVLIKASDIYCSRLPACSTSALGPILSANNANCANAIKLDTSTDLYQAFWAKLRLKLADNQVNLPEKAIFERCTEDVGVKILPYCGNLARSNGAYPNPLGVDLLDAKDDPLTVNVPDIIMTQYKGKFFKFKEGQCWTCIAETLLLPNLSQAAMANKKLSGYASPHITNSKPINIERVINLQDKNPKLEQTRTKASLGIDNYSKKIDVVSFSPILQFITALINGMLKTPDNCSVSWIDEILHISGLDELIPIAQNSCDAQTPAKVETILWTTTASQEVYEYSQRLNTGLLPYQKNEQNKNRIDDYHGFETKLEADLGGCQGAREMSPPDAGKTTSCGDNGPDGQMVPVLSGKDGTATQNDRYGFFIPMSEQSSSRNSQL